MALIRLTDLQWYREETACHMSIFSRDLDEQQEDDSGIPRKTIAGVVMVCMTIAGAVILFASGLAWWAGRGRSTSWSQNRDNRPNTSLARHVDVAADNDSSLRQPMWRVRPDRNLLPPLAPVTEGMLALGAGEGLLFPATRSTFVVSEPGPMSQVRTVLNLATLEPVGAISTSIPVAPPYALSPDGRHFAGVAATSPSLIIEIYSTHDGRNVKSLSATGFAGHLRTLAFLDNEHVLAMLSQGSGCVVYVWKTSSGVLHGPVAIAAPQTDANSRWLMDNSWQLSAPKLTVHRCPDGRSPVGSISQEDDADSLIYTGLAFSPDMSELAAYSAHGETSRIVTWNLENGKKTGAHVVSRGRLLKAASDTLPSGPVLEWLPNRDGWLVFGCLLVGREQEARVKTITRSEGAPTFLVRARVVGTDHLAVLQDRQGLRSIQVIPIPRGAQR